jgi:phosphate transport system permease protein
MQARGALSTSFPIDDLRLDRSGHVRFRTNFDRWIGYLLPFLFLAAIFPILDLVYYVSVKALPTLTWNQLTSESIYGHTLGVPIIGTFEIITLATLFALLFGLFGGIATAEFLPDRTATWVRTMANILAGTPSVVVGYFGFFAFVKFFGWGLSLIAGVFTLSFFMTPYVFRATDLAFASVPRSIREAALGSGAKPSQYILRVATPIAFPQILTGVFLAMAIGVGETAPLVLTTTEGILPPQNLLSPVTFLTGLIWTNFQYSSTEVYAFQAAFILLVTVVGLNIVVRVIAARYRRRLEGLFQ